MNIVLSRSHEQTTPMKMLARLASTKVVDLLGLIPVEHLSQPSIVEEDYKH